MWPSWHHSSEGSRRPGPGPERDYNPPGGRGRDVGNSFAAGRRDGSMINMFKFDRKRKLSKFKLLKSLFLLDLMAVSYFWMI